MREIYLGRNSEIVDGMLKIDHLEFDDNLLLRSNKILTTLPDGLRIKGWLDLNGCTALTALPDGLVVNEWMNLSGCTSLKSLPSDLIAYDSIYLVGCTALESLPENLTVGETLYVQDCTALTELPKGLFIKRSLNLSGCTGLTALPDDLRVGYAVIFEGMTIFPENRLVLERVALPETAKSLCIGCRLGDVVDHWALRWKGLQDRIIESAEINFEGDLDFDLKPAS